MAKPSLMELATKEYAGYHSLSKKMHRRWAKMLEERAIRFYIDTRLDSCVASEDLYVSEEEQDKGEYVNLDYSIAEEKKYYKELKDIVDEVNKQ